MTLPFGEFELVSANTLVAYITDVVMDELTEAMGEPPVGSDLAVMGIVTRVIQILVEEGALDAVKRGYG